MNVSRVCVCVWPLLMAHTYVWLLVGVASHCFLITFSSSLLVEAPWPWGSSAICVSLFRHFLCGRGESRIVIVFFSSFGNRSSHQDELSKSYIMLTTKCIYSSPCGWRHTNECVCVASYDPIIKLHSSLNSLVSTSMFLTFALYFLFFVDVVVLIRVTPACR